VEGIVRAAVEGDGWKLEDPVLDIQEINGLVEYVIQGFRNGKSKRAMKEMIGDMIEELKDDLRGPTRNSTQPIDYDSDDEFEEEDVACGRRNKQVFEQYHDLMTWKTIFPETLMMKTTRFFYIYEFTFLFLPEKL